VGQRVNLRYVDGQLHLPCVIECKSLRLGRHFTTFVIDTGSTQSLLSDGEVKALQISLTGKRPDGQIRFGGSTYDKVPLPKITMHLMHETQQKVKTLQVSLCALKTHRISEEKRTVAESLPSVLGMDFLETHNLALHVAPKEKVAYLEYDE